MNEASIPVKPSATKQVAELKAWGAAWLRYHRLCPLVCAERTPLIDPLIPDLIGVTKSRHVIEVEIKVSFADFVGNRNKRGLALRSRWPQQFYFLISEDIEARVVAAWSADILGPLWGRAGLMVPGSASNFGGRDLICRHPSPKKESMKLSMRDVSKMVKHQSGTLVSALQAVANLHAP